MSEAMLNLSAVLLVMGLTGVGVLALPWSDRELRATVNALAAVRESGGAMRAEAVRQAAAVREWLFASGWWSAAVRPSASVAG